MGCNPILLIISPCNEPQMSKKEKTSANLKVDSFKEFLRSGSATTIKTRTLKFLRDNPDKVFTAKELVAELDLIGRSSISLALVELVKEHFIERFGTKYDTNTNREIGSYWAVDSLPKAAANV
jgi:hypothetical protein